MFHQLAHFLPPFLCFWDFLMRDLGDGPRGVAVFVCSRLDDLKKGKKRSATTRQLHTSVVVSFMSIRDTTSGEKKIAAKGQKIIAVIRLSHGQQIRHTATTSPLHHLQ
jgi:hypothetical protein